jgi:excisionase family DNA binding protein
MTSDEKLDEILGLLEKIRAGQGSPLSPWLTPEQAAVYLGVSRTRVYRYMQGDRIPYHRLPDSNLVRFDARELDGWVRNGCEAANTISDEQIRRLLK